MPIFSVDPFTNFFWDRDFFVTPVSSENFELNLNVEPFKPEEITLKLTESNVLVIEGKHEERKEEDGSVSRHFVKKHQIPEGFDLKKIHARFFPNSILSISAPKIKNIDENTKSKDIPVIRVKNNLKSKL